MSNGLITTIAGNGVPGYAGDGGPATKARLVLPTGLAVDSSSSLYVADYGTHSVRKVSGGMIATIAGNGTAGFSGDDQAGSTGQLNGPIGISLTAGGELFIADSGNNRIRRLSGSTISTVAGNGTNSSATGIGDGGAATSALLNAPAGVAFDSAGNFYIADENNQRVREVTNGIITTAASLTVPAFGGEGGPASDAVIGSPSGVAVDANGAIYFSDTTNYAVRKISDGTLTTVAGGGSVRGENIPATSADLSPTPFQCSDVTSLAVDGNGNLYIGSGCRARIWKVENGFISTVAGGGITTADNVPADTASLGGTQMAVDSARDLYIADEGNYRVRKISHGVITTVAGNGVLANAGPENVAATSAPLGGYPLAVAVSPSGDLYITTSIQLIRKVSNGIITTVMDAGTQGGGLDIFGRMAVDPAGTLYVSEPSLNLISKVINGSLVTIAGTSTAGLSGEGVLATHAGLNSPEGLAILRISPAAGSGSCFRRREARLPSPSIPAGS